MTLEADLLQARAEAESLMIDSCIVHRLGELVTDDDGNVSPSLSEVYAGRCKLQTTVAQAASPVSAEHVFTVENLQLHFPVGSGLQVNDLVTLLATPLDDSNAGLVFRIVEAARGSFRTAARWNVELVTG